MPRHRFPIRLTCSEGGSGTVVTCLVAQRETDNDEVGAVPVIGPGQEDLDDENRNTLYLTYPCSEPNNYAVFEAKYMLAFSQSIISQRLAEFVPSNFIDRNDKPRVRRPMDPRGSGIESYGRIDLHCNVLGTAVCMPVTAYIVETEHFYDESLVHGSQGLGETDLILNGYIEIADYVESMQIARRALIDQSPRCNSSVQGRKTWRKWLQEKLLVHKAK